MRVYTEYFQKSKVFLYPLLKIKNNITNIPIQTYIAWDKIYSPNDFKFFCEYKTKKNKIFEKFSKDYLLYHPLFYETIELNENTQLFIYDFSKYKIDFQNFLVGKYSQFTLNSKITILDFFEKKIIISNYVKGFLNPEIVHNDYAKELQVDIASIQAIYEVCTPPNIKKETLVNNNYVISKLSKNSSIYLIS